MLQMNGCYLNHENGNYETCSLKTSKNNSLVVLSQVEFLKETIPQYIEYSYYPCYVELYMVTLS